MRHSLLLFTFFLTTVAQAAPLPANNYDCYSYAQLFLNGEKQHEDVQTEITGFVLTPDSPEYFYMNLGIVKFVHRLGERLVYTGADTGLLSYNSNPKIMYSTAKYYHLSPAWPAPDSKVLASAGFQIPMGELPQIFEIPLEPIVLDEDEVVLVRLSCKFRETVDR